MKIKPLLYFQGVLFAIFGLMFLFIPVQAMSAFVGGLGVSPSFYLLTRMTGGTSIGLSIILLGATRFDAPNIKQVLAVGLIVQNLSGAILHAMGVLQGLVLPAGWSITVLDGILVLLYASTLLKKEA